jgi:hypothetical protein
VRGHEAGWDQATIRYQPRIFVHSRDPGEARPPGAPCRTLSGADSAPSQRQCADCRQQQTGGFGYRTTEADGPLDREVEFRIVAAARFGQASVFITIQSGAPRTIRESRAGRRNSDGGRRRPERGPSGSKAIRPRQPSGRAWERIPEREGLRAAVSLGPLSDDSVVSVRAVVGREDGEATELGVAIAEIGPRRLGEPPPDRRDRTAAWAV